MLYRYLRRNSQISMVYPLYIRRVCVCFLCVCKCLSVSVNVCVFECIYRLGIYRYKSLNKLFFVNTSQSHSLIQFLQLYYYFIVNTITKSAIIINIAPVVVCKCSMLQLICFRLKYRKLAQCKHID